MQKKILLLHTLGLSAGVTASLFMVWTFWRIHTDGRFVVYEDAYWVRYTELAVSVYSVLYSFYLWANFVWKRSADDVPNNLKSK